MTMVKLFPSWPTTISSLLQFLSFALHPFLTHHVLTVAGFSFPATLAFVQVAITAICLWFWSIFGLYHVRTISLKSLFPLALSAAVLAVLAVLTLARTSLLVFQTARLLSATFVLAVRSNTPAPLPVALLSAVFLVMQHGPDLVIPICYAVFTAANALFLHPIAAKTKASEVQLQLLLRSLASVLLIIPALILDILLPTADKSLREFAFGDNEIILVVSTGLVAFVSFTASRASTHKLSAETQNWLLLAANLAVFLCHFVTQEELVLGWHPLGILGLVASWWFLAEKRRKCLKATDTATDDGRIRAEGV